MIRRFLIGVKRTVLLSLMAFSTGYIPLALSASQSFEEMYGSELKSAPYSVRVRYANDSGKPWAEATYDERHEYLIALYKEEMAETIAQENAEISRMQIEAQKEMGRVMDDLAEKNKELQKERIKMDKKLAEDRKKMEYQQKSLQQQQKLQQLRAQSENRR